MPQCPATHPTSTTHPIYCTLEENHQGLHRVNEGPPWTELLVPRVTCKIDLPNGETCVLTKNHWDAHRDSGGWQWSEDDVYCRDLVRPLPPTLWDRLLDREVE